MISAAELADLASFFASACDQSATVKRNLGLGTPGADGTVADVFTTIYTNIPAMLATPQGSYQLQAAADLVDQATWVVSFPATIAGVQTDVRPADQVLIAGLTLTAQHVLTPQSYSVAHQVLASMPR